jgi:hypothetical protein
MKQRNYNNMNTFLIKFEIFTSLAGSNQFFSTSQDLLESIDDVYDHLTKDLDMDEYGVSEEGPDKFKGMN